jgi:hypothetical protein
MKGGKGDMQHVEVVRAVVVRYRTLSRIFSITSKLFALLVCRVNIRAIWYDALYHSSVRQVICSLITTSTYCKFHVAPRNIHFRLWFHTDHVSVFFLLKRVFIFETFCIFLYKILCQCFGNTALSTVYYHFLSE